MSKALRMTIEQFEAAKNKTKKPPVKTKSEHEIQVEFFKWWRTYAELKDIPIPLCFAIPNSRRLSDAGRIYAWKEGLTAGVPDVFMAIPNKDYHGLFIEFKSEKGKPTPEQKAFLEFAKKQGYMTVLAYSFENALEATLTYLHNANPWDCA